MSEELVGFTVRPRWSDAPAPVRKGVAAALGSDEVGSTDIHGGMSPGPAAMLRLADGRRVFVKAVSSRASHGSHELYGWEADVLALLPGTVPAANLLTAVRWDDWIALVTGWAPGKPAGPPWTDATIAAIADACIVLAEHDAPAGIPPIIDRLPKLDGWLTTSSGPLDEWEREHIDALVAAIDGWRIWTGGRSIVHHDLRGDNAIIDSETGHATLVDWSYCSAGAPWFDRALLAADIMAAGHIDGPERACEQALAVLSPLPVEAGRLVIAEAGMWRHNSTLPAHTGLPTHRAWQRQRALALRPLLTRLIADVI